MHYDFVDHDLLTEMERTAYGKGDTTTAQLLGDLVEARAKIAELEGELDALKRDMDDVNIALNGIKEIIDGL